MIGETIKGIMIPFLGTSFGAACVFFMNGKLERTFQQALVGFAGGVMTAASIWSLLIPSLEQAGYLGKLSFVPAAVGFLLGIGSLLALDQLIPYLHKRCVTTAGAKTLSSSGMLMLAVTLHNVPEGMAVGVVYAGLLYGDTEITVAGALVLSIGIAIQNFPEGAIISMPMKVGGMEKKKAFFYGVLSGAAEPLGGALTILAAGVFLPVLPYLLSFSAGAMLYVVVEELIPEIAGRDHSARGIALFGAGFVLMMILDVALG